MQQQNLKVTVRLMYTEYKKLKDCAISNFVIRRHISRRMRRKKVLMRHVTHKAQSTQHLVEAMRDWMTYVLGQMQMLNIPYENVAKFDARFQCRWWRTTEFERCKDSGG
jgi:hypothetical protein